MEKTNNLYLTGLIKNDSYFDSLTYSNERNQEKKSSLHKSQSDFILKINEKIETIDSLIIPETARDLVELLNNLQNHLFISGWKSAIGSNQTKAIENKWNNKLSNIILLKYNVALKKLEQNYPENEFLDDFKFLSKKLSFKKFLDNFGIF
jgi:hypothetical protein